MRKLHWFAWGLGFCILLQACTHHVEVEPVHITIDVNVKLDKAVQDYFGEVFEVEDQVRDQIPEQDETKSSPGMEAAEEVEK